MNEIIALNRCGEEALYAVRASYDGCLFEKRAPALSFASPDAIALTMAIYLREWSRLQPSGVVATMRSWAEKLQTRQPELARAYQKITDEIVAFAVWMADDSTDDSGEK